VFFCCKRFDGIRNSYLFNWYSYDRNVPNFYTLMSSTNEETIYKTALYVEKLLRHFKVILYSYLIIKKMNERIIYQQIYIMNV